MYVPFDELSQQARVWVYQSDRRLTEAEVLFIKEAAPAFLNEWATHGNPLRASFQLIENQFLVLAVEESAQAASGCSIDSSVSFIKALEKELQLSFMDRAKVAFAMENQVILEALPQIRNSIAAGKITAETQTYNTLVNNKQELEEKWLLPAKETWLKRYFS